MLSEGWPGLLRQESEVLMLEVWWKMWWFEKREKVEEWLLLREVLGSLGLLWVVSLGWVGRCSLLSPKAMRRARERKELIVVVGLWGWVLVFCEMMEGFLEKLHSGGFILDRQSLLHLAQLTVVSECLEFLERFTDSA